MDVKYRFKNVPIIGGGFVTGLLFDKSRKGLLYARTDVGTAYRFDFRQDRWKPVCAELNGSPLAMAASDGKFLMICGKFGGKGVLCVSEDCGNSFVFREVPAYVNANCRGRGTGERLCIKDKRLLFASEKDGLLVSEDLGESWKELDLLGSKRFTFVYGIDGSDVVLAGCAEKENNLFVSVDGGRSFNKADYVESGYAAVRAADFGGYVYIGFNKGESEDTFSCDSGKVRFGKILRFEIDKNGLKNAVDVTPYEILGKNFGIGGITANSDYIAFPTVCESGGDSVSISYDSGTSWKKVIRAHNGENYRCNCSYMDTTHNDGSTMMHWASSLEADPFDTDTLFFNTGTGVFRIREMRSGKPYFEDMSFGIEETVHMNVYSPVRGKFVLLDAVGDLGGFAFEDPDKECENTFTDENGKRFITVMNIDYSDRNDVAVCTPRGNWVGSSKGGAAVSFDGGGSWKRCEMPYGISDYIDGLCQRIERPNTNSGWAALSADEKQIVWTLCEWFRLPEAAVVYSEDLGKSWNKVKVFDLDGREINNSEIMLKPMADRVDENLFYGFGNNGEVFVSVDKGKSFYQKKSPFPPADMGFCDGKNRTEIRCQYGRKGVIWLALGIYGLWKMIYENGEFRAEKVLDGVVSAQGMGKGNVLFVSIDTPNGSRLLRSEDEGKSWEKISNQCFGHIGSVCGDYRKAGRVYFGTGGRGLFYGDEEDS